MVFICNQYRHRHLSIIRAIARGELLPHLENLICNPHQITSTSDQLSQAERVHIRALYEYLFVDREQLKPDLQIVIHGLVFTHSRQYNECGYHLKLIEYQFNDTRNIHPILPCPSVSTAVYLDALDTFFGADEQLVTANGTNKFFQLYLNLRIIHLDNRTRRLEIAPDRLLAFLGRCKGLTSLEFHWANLSPDFYAALAQLPSLATLDFLAIFEECGEFAHLIDFQLLTDRFRFLRNFHSNVAPLSTMLLLLHNIPAGACFIFDFWRPGMTERRCTIWRRGECYALLGQVQDDEGGDLREYHQETFTDCLTLAHFLIRHNPGFELFHWLE